MPRRIDLRRCITALAILQVETLLQSLVPGEAVEIVSDREPLMRDLMRVLRDCAFEKGPEDETTAGGGGLFIVRRQPPAEPRSTHMTDAELSSLTIGSTADARGSACPGPLLEAKKGIGKVKVGEVLEIYSNDSGTRTDIPAWAGKVGHEYLGMLAADGYDKHFVRRKK